MVSHHPANFSGHRHKGGGDMFLVVEEQDSSKIQYACLYLPLLLSLKLIVCLRKFDIKRRFTKQTISGVSNEIIPILVTHVMGNNLYNIHKKYQSAQKHWKWIDSLLLIPILYIKLSILKCLYRLQYIVWIYQKWEGPNIFSWGAP